MTEHASESFQQKPEQAETRKGSADQEKSEFGEFGEFISATQHAHIDCQLTVLVNNQGHATKVFGLDDSGQLRKRSAVNIYEGTALRIGIKSLEELGGLLGRLEPNQALCFGVPEREQRSAPHARDVAIWVIS